MDFSKAWIQVIAWKLTSLHKYPQQKLGLPLLPLKENQSQNIKHLLINSDFNSSAPSPK